MYLLSKRTMPICHQLFILRSHLHGECISTDDDLSAKSYIRLTEGTSLIKHEKYSYRTELSKHIWKLKNKGKQYKTNDRLSQRQVSITTTQNGATCA